MVDFLVISTRENKKNIEIFPNFKILNSKDLMIRGGDFYAIWLEDQNRWSTNEQDAIDLIDVELDKYVRAHTFGGLSVQVKYMWDSSSGVIDRWHKYCQHQLRDNWKPLDNNILFANDIVDKKAYSSKRLNYPIEDKDIPNWDQLLSTLYSPYERHKIEWAIGAIVTGASKKIQKYFVLYGPPGTGKSTILNIIQNMFEDYVGVFDAESLGSTSDFALEQFKSNPLIAICQDGDLSHIERNARLNSLVSHEKMIVNEKHRPTYAMTFNCLLLMGTNKPVRITDAKAGSMRRLVDIQPTGNTIPVREYNRINKSIIFEYGGICAHCRDVYLENPHYYDDYKPMEMIGATNDFYNFVSDNYILFKKYDSTTLKEAWELYKIYTDDARVTKSMNRRAFGEELKNYFRHFEDRKRSGDDFIRSYYSGFKHEIFDGPDEKEVNKEAPKEESWIKFKDATTSIFDQQFKDMPAQYALDAGTPSKKWDNVTTKLSDIDPTQLHYCKLPVANIIIDFDLKDEKGEKSLERNLEAASKWPKTYAELSKSGAGIHLVYLYTGENPEQLSRIYDDDIEIKVFTGNSALRRKLTKCNDEPINTISTGLPFKEEKMINFDVIKNEKALRTLIKRNLNKEYHSSTRCSVDFIYEILKQAYDSGMKYDVSDLKTVIYSFAAHSTNQSDYCTKLVGQMMFKSDEPSDAITNDEAPIVFYDIEVFPNLLLVNWKLQDVDGKKHKINRMINPTPQEIEKLFKYRLVGFNNRKYDNHIIWARFLGKDNDHIYKMSQKIISGNKDAFLGEAYNISYTDIYDYCSNANKMSLKKWEIKLGLHHQELGLDWDEPVPEELWPLVSEYCDNDVISTEAVWNATQEDFVAREILVEICHALGMTNMTVNDTTNTLTTKIIFRNNKNPQLNYVDLSKEFPGYEFVKYWDENAKKYVKKNMYRGVDLGFGGYVYAEPGMYGDVALLDIASLHPHSIIAMNLFGDYTKNFKDLVDMRVLIKHKDLETAQTMFDGKLAHLLQDPAMAKKLSTGLKTAINSVYGLTSAAFDNPFKDARNENNIVALRGALFMKTLQDKVAARGFTVAHIKTDSIKIPDATPEIIDMCMKFANKYGYTFEHEATYDRICLVNDAVYIAKYKDNEQHEFELSTGEKVISEWTATGAEFQVPYVFKTLFANLDVNFKDLCVTKSVSNTSMYLLKSLDNLDAEDNAQFVGRVGLFAPMSVDNGGRYLMRKAITQDGLYKYDAVTGTKGYFWMDAEDIIKEHKENDVDMTYWYNMTNEVIKHINKIGTFDWFVSDDAYRPPVFVDGRPDYEATRILPF